jgi:DNA-binding cell septation regulator SpoVG
MKPEDIAVEVRLSSKQDQKVKAFADITFPLGGDGVVKVFGFSIIVTDGSLPRVVPPARKGTQRYFEIVALIGKVRSIVDTAVLAEYQRLTKTN